MEAQIRNRIAKYTAKIEDNVKVITRTSITHRIEDEMKALVILSQLLEMEQHILAVKKTLKREFKNVKWNEL